MIPNTEFELFEPTTELTKSIKPINRDTVHKICSGQVVLDLATAVKELVENSIDAGATLVEIKLKEQGLEQVEVVDNGSGVEEFNLVGLTAKYHTSKLREFTDLEGVATFGFRGEALSSLCALSDMIITTRHSSAQHGTKLELDHRGKMKYQSPCARQVGTTVSLTNLFATLPVRKKEFKKNIKKEFTRLCQILQAYCLVSVGVRIICTNQSKKGGKTTVMYTNGNTNIMDNISAIFGAKQSKDLLELKPALNNVKNLDISVTEFLDDSDINQEEIDKLNLSRFGLQGWISNCCHGSGRSSKDRQFFYVNSRPIENKQIIKLVNEIYHRYNANQYPFVFLNITLDRSDVDVNLTPDKRQVLINNEKILLLALKKSLINTFVDIPSTFKYQNLDFSIKIIDSKNQINKSFEETKTLVKPNSKKFSQMLSQWKATGKTDKSCEVERKKRKVSDEIEVRTMKMKKIQEMFSQDSIKIYKTEDEKYSYESDNTNSDSEFDKVNKLKSVIDKTDIFTTNISTTQLDVHEPIKEIETIFIQSSDKINNEDELFKSLDKEIITSCKVNEKFNENKLIMETDDKKCNVKNTNNTNFPSTSKNLELDDIQIIGESNIPNNYGKVITLTTSINTLKLLSESEEKLRKKSTQKIKLDRLKFKTEINPADNKNAEKELQREITKDMFSQMEIIGQFNLGFIIAKLDDDLFIIDQHATDEKYNFEMLEKTTVMQNQKLVLPQSLELTAMNEIILIDNLEIFKMNGFDFLIDENAEPTKKIKLIAKPMSKNWEFGKEDIDELIFMLQDAPTNTICRPSRVSKMFASRACRKSVMIGTSLDKTIMRKLINHMGEIEQPWNCPHGRPTIRHLINLAMLDGVD